MQVEADASFNAEDVKGLCEQLNTAFTKLFAILQKQPNFYLDVDPATPLPANLPPRTIVFQMGANNTLKLGIYDGENVNTSI